MHAHCFPSATALAHIDFRMASTSSAVRMPVFRILVGFDKLAEDSDEEEEEEEEKEEEGDEEEEEVATGRDRPSEAVHSACILLSL